MMKCPKCERPLQVAGEMNCDGKLYAVFQCDECITNIEVDGEEFAANFTFAVCDGKYFDAESLDPLDLN